MFYFAWVDKEDKTFGPEHHRVDEDVFSLVLVHSEGDFPSVEVDIRNPRMGFLAPSRKQWVWLSYDNGSEVTPLFFGRIVGVPQSLQSEVVRVTFVARPSDYDEQKSAIAEGLRVLPYYDPLWLSTVSQEDPDKVLEGYTRLWHIDRLTHEVSTSDIITGEDGNLSYTSGSDVFYDSVSVTHGQSPARKVVVVAKVEWGQGGSGSINITPDVMNAFKQSTPPDILTIDGMAHTTEGMITVVCGEQLLNQWPYPGDRVGSGWTIGDTELKLVGGYPLPPTIVDSAVVDQIAMWSGTGINNAIKQLFGRTPGLAVSVVDYTNDTRPSGSPFQAFDGEFNILWVPVYRLACHMEMTYDIYRARSETVTFSVSADVQSLLSDPDDAETVYLDAGSAEVDVLVDGVMPIGSTRRAKYFETDRGKSSFEHLLNRARAILVSRSRAVDVTFSMPFDEGLELSCRKTATLYDDRLPGGQATGKIKSYSLTVDGASGNMYASVTVGCVVGRGGSPVYVPGDNSYVDDGYVSEGWQYVSGQTVVPDIGDLSYDNYDGYAIDDDGVPFMNLGRKDAVVNVTVTGGLITEMENAQNGGAASTGAEVMDRVNSVETVLRIEMLPLAGGPFDTEFQVTVHDLVLPKMIDLEAD